MPADGGGKRGAGLRKRKDSTEGAVVVVVNAHPPRTPHDHMERNNRPFADNQLDFSIVSLAENVVFFQRYSTAKILFKKVAGSKVLDEYYNSYLRK